MGYRQMQPGVWGKPLAYQIFIARKVRGEWEVINYFKGNDKLHVWDRKTFADLDELKYAEMEIGKIVTNGQGSEFDFETPEEVFAALL